MDITDIKEQWSHGVNRVKCSSGEDLGVWWTRVFLRSFFNAT